MKPTRPAATSPPPAKVSRRRPPWWVVIVSVVFVATAATRLAVVDGGLSREDARACAAELSGVLDVEAPVAGVEAATATLADGEELPVWRATMGDRSLVVLVDIAKDDGTVVAVEPRVGSLQPAQRQLLFGHRCG